MRRFAVTEQGWEADVEVENRTGVPWEMGEDPVAVEQSFGIMLFATGELDEVERRSRDGDLPGLRTAQEFDPTLPARLGPGSSWRGTSRRRGSLAAGRYVRVVFGPLIAVGDPPDEHAGAVRVDHRPRVPAAVLNAPTLRADPSRARVHQQ